MQWFGDAIELRGLIVEGRDHRYRISFVTSMMLRAFWNIQCILTGTRVLEYVELVGFFFLTQYKKSQSSFCIQFSCFIIEFALALVLLDAPSSIISAHHSLKDAQTWAFAFGQGSHGTTVLTLHDDIDLAEA
jgi:hypothetical protein